MRTTLIGYTLLVFSFVTGCNSKTEPPPAREAQAFESNTVQGHAREAQAFESKTVQVQAWEGSWVTSVSFVDASRGWIILNNHDVLSTTDRGLTWTKITSIPFITIQIQFVSQSVGWARTTTGLIRTKDEGRTWTKVALDETEFRSMSFIDSDHGWLAGASKVLATTDGGQTWANFASPCGAQTDQALSFISKKTGWLVCGERDLGWMPKQLLRTDDGGQTWLVVTESKVVKRNGLPVGEDTQGGLPASGYVAGLFFRDDNHGWLTTVQGIVWRTSDGHSWEKLPSGFPGPTSHFSNIQFLDLEHGYMLLSKGSGWAVVETVDGGKTWKDVYVTK